MSALTRGTPSSARDDPLIRESPLPDFAGEAGSLDGRVVVAIAKCMALCGLRPVGAHRAGIRRQSGYSPRRSVPNFKEIRDHRERHSTDGSEQTQQREKREPTH